VNEAEGGLKRFVDDVSQIVLHLLRFLNIDEVKGKTGEPVDVFVLNLLLLLQLLYFQPHITADSPHVRVIFHMAVHFVYCGLFGFESHVHEHSVAWVQFPAESVEKPIVRRQFTRVLVFHTHKQIHVPLHSLLIFLNEGRISLNFLGRRQDDLLPKRSKIAQVLPSLDILINKGNGLVDGLSGNDLAFVGIVSIFLNDLLLVQL